MSLVRKLKKGTVDAIQMISRKVVSLRSNAMKNVRMDVVSVVWCHVQGTLTTLSVVVQQDLIAIGGMEKDVKKEYVPWNIIIAENNIFYCASN